MAVVSFVTLVASLDHLEVGGQISSFVLLVETTDCLAVGFKYTVVVGLLA
jgi:multidrug transporter EmrE-like cation transporter